MQQQVKAEAATTQADLEQLVAEADTGGRKPKGLPGQILLWVAIAWSLFQLWYASPLPFMLGFGVLNDTEARSIHFGFAMFLAFTCYPALKRSRRDRIPISDWVLAVAGGDLRKQRLRVGVVGIAAGHVVAGAERASAAGDDHDAYAVVHLGLHQHLD